MIQKNTITKAQLMKAAFISLLSPAIRFLPEMPARLGGAAAWLSPLAAAIPVFLYVLLINKFMAKRAPGEGLGQMIVRSTGQIPGKIILVIFGLWLLFYSGFILRMSAERFLSSVYENGNLSVFLVVTLAASFIAAIGKIRSVGRMASAYIVIIALCLAVVLIFTLPDIKKENLLPVSYLETGNVLKGALPVFSVITGYVYFEFLTGHTEKKAGDGRHTFACIGAILLCLFLISFVTIGILSANLCARLQNPFFIAERNVEILGIVERMESVIISFWVFSDFMYLTVLIMAITEIGGIVFGISKRTAAVCAECIIILVISASISNTAFGFKTVSEVIVPAVHLTFSVIIVPFIIFFGFFKKSI